MPDSPAVVVPTNAGGSLQPAEATAVVPLKGGALALAPLPLGGGKRKTKKVPKKILKLFKKGSAKKLRKMMKGGVDAKEVVMGGDVEGDGAVPGITGARRYKTRRGSRNSRRRY